MKAVILAAGRGTRLEPVTSDISKCMLPIVGKPLIAHILNTVKDAGIEEIILIVGYKKEKIKDHFGDGSNHGLSIQYIDQKEMKGTAHAIGMAKINTDFLVLNGDTLISSEDINNIVKNHETAATIGVRKVEDPTNYGVVEDEGGRVKAIVEKPKKYVSNLLILRTLSQSNKRRQRNGAIPRCQCGRRPRLTIVSHNETENRLIIIERQMDT